MVGRLYLEHLSDADLALLSSAGEPARAVHADPERIEALIDSPALFRVLFGTPGRDPLLRASPFLLLAVLIPLAAVRLSTDWRPLAVLERHLSGLRRRAARRRAAAPPAGTRARRRGPGTRGASRWDLAARTARPPGISSGAAGNRPVGGDGRRAG